MTQAMATHQSAVAPAASFAAVATAYPPMSTANATIRRGKTTTKNVTNWRENTLRSQKGVLNDSMVVRSASLSVNPPCQPAVITVP